MKYPGTRIHDTTEYIRVHVSGGVAAELRHLYARASYIDQLDINMQVSLDAHLSYPTGKAPTNQRHALRALLLCQRIYFSPIWRRYGGSVAQLKPADPLDPQLLPASRSHWQNRSEQEILAALQIFRFSPQAVAADLADVAELGPPQVPQKNDLYKMTRSSFTAGLTSICYNAVMTWLYQAGLASIQWLRRYWGANTQDSLTEAFGAGEVIWRGKFGRLDALPHVPRGHVVHIYRNDANWGGHWMVSLGQGWAAGVNNNDEPGTHRAYSDFLTLDHQFLEYGGGVAIALDPLDIPSVV